MSSEKDRPNYVLWGILGLVVLGLIGLFIYNAVQPRDLSKAAWNVAMTKGDPEAEHSFIEYTDVTCSHCADFHNAAENGDFDAEYIDSDKVYYEVRVVPLLKDRRQNSVRSAEAAYCAADQEKFWPYYDSLVDHFTKTYFEKI